MFIHIQPATIGLVRQNDLKLRNFIEKKSLDPFSMLAPSLDSLGKDMECEEQSTASSLDIVIKWNGNDYDVKNLNTNSDVKTLKDEIFKCTGVRPERQKLINLRISGYYIF